LDNVEDGENIDDIFLNEDPAETSLKQTILKMSGLDK
jgi:hypothetical protein